MFIPTDSPTGHFTLLPMPREFFEIPPPFGGGALLVLNKFANNSASLRAEHMLGIQLAAAQAAATFGPNTGSLEVYGLTDRTGSEKLNKELSGRRARAALEALRGVMGLGDFRATFANGLGERFAAEYFALVDNTRDDMFRGVACYLWESFTMARDPVLRLEISFATPPTGGSPRRRTFLAALHMGRLRAQPTSPFA